MLIRKHSYLCVSSLLKFAMHSTNGSVQRVHVRQLRLLTKYHLLGAQTADMEFSQFWRLESPRSRSLWTQLLVGTRFLVSRQLLADILALPRGMLTEGQTELGPLRLP